MGKDLLNAFKRALLFSGLVIGIPIILFILIAIGTYLLKVNIVLALIYGVILMIIILTYLFYTEF